VASFGLYVAFRAAYVYTGQVKYRLMCLISLLLGTARMLTIFFVLYEILLPLFMRHGSARKLKFSLIAAVVCALAVGIFSILNPEYFIGAFYRELTSDGLEQNYSLTNRLETIEWGLENWERIVTIGGIASNEFRNFDRAVDSEAVLRSMQFGITGFLLMVVLVYGYFHKYRSYDTFFLLAIMLWTSLTASAASNFVLCPFLLVYGFACRARAQATGAAG
jgi:hypothetical protein